MSSYTALFRGYVVQHRWDSFFFFSNIFDLKLIEPADRANYILRFAGHMCSLLLGLLNSAIVV